MGLFGSLFDKKTCGVCGAEIGLFGNNKLEDADMCDDCAGKLSPYFEGRRHTRLAEIKEQLEYREKNKKAVAAFNPTLTVGTYTKVYVDEDAGKLIVCDQRDWRGANPDVFDFDQVMGVDVNVDESRYEQYHDNAKGESVSYNPPRYKYEYDFYVTIHINHPYVSQIRFKVNNCLIERRASTDYKEAQRTCDEIKRVLQDLHTTARASKAPKTAVTCPHCMATTMPDENGRCEYCGGAIG